MQSPALTWGLSSIVWDKPTRLGTIGINTSPWTQAEHWRKRLTNSSKSWDPDSLTEFLTAWAPATWQVLADSALYFLMGLVLAGLVWTILNEKNLRTLLGRNRNQAVFRAALLGVVASQLRASGLSRGGTVSFLISTPESSVDSILLTYSLTDPLLTVARPIAAFLTAVTAGLFENSFQSEALPEGQPGDSTSICECGSLLTVDVPPAGWSARIIAGFKHSFTTLIGDLAPYLLLGSARHSILPPGVSGGHIWQPL